MIIAGKLDLAGRVLRPEHVAILVIPGGRRLRAARSLGLRRRDRRRGHDLRGGQIVPLRIGVRGSLPLLVIRPGILRLAGHDVNRLSIIARLGKISGCGDRVVRAIAQGLAVVGQRLIAVKHRVPPSPLLVSVPRLFHLRSKDAAFTVSSLAAPKREKAKNNRARKMTNEV